MKKFLSLMLVFVMVFALAACGSKDGGEDAKTDGAIDYDKISDTMESEDGKYELAFVTDVGQLRDGSFNQLPGTESRRTLMKTIFLTSIISQLTAIRLQTQTDMTP